MSFAFESNSYGFFLGEPPYELADGNAALRFARLKRGLCRASVLQRQQPRLERHGGFVAAAGNGRLPQQRRDGVPVCEFNYGVNSLV